MRSAESASHGLMAASIDLNRIKKELKDCNKDPDVSGIKASLVADTDYLHWTGTIKGPIDTPYQGGVFVIDITLPNDYPFVPPKVSAARVPWAAPARFTRASAMHSRTHDMHAPCAHR